MVFGESMPRNALAVRIADDISSSVLSGQLEIGAHLSAQKLADQFGVSRSPVREAMEVLEERGVVQRIPNRGYFIKKAQDFGDTRGDSGSNPFDQPNDYQKVAADWLSDEIPGEVTEQFLRERYGLTKTQLSDILLRASREGWVERKQGYGWRFLPVAKTAETFEQIYRFRMLIEPAAMLEPSFMVDMKIIAEQREIQQRMLDRDIEVLPGEKLLDNGSLFHEELIKMSGNPFFHQALVRINRMRRLMEYRSRVDRRRLYTQCSQHIEILDLLRKGNVMDASFLMRKHLGGALATKSPIDIGEHTENQSK
jgi:DNA-binding GntR family transcriptional regulator